MGDRIFVGSCSGRFYSLDRSSGEPVWIYDTTQDGRRANFHGDVLVAEDRLVVGSDVAEPGTSSPPQGHVYCFAAEDGTVHWKYPVDGGVLSRIVRFGSRVYGVTKSGTLLCLQLADGSLQWTARPEAESTRASTAYDLRVIGDRVVFSSVEGIVMAVDADDGSTEWIVGLDGWVNTGLARAGGSLWVGTSERELHRLDPETGQLEDTYRMEHVPYGSPVAVEQSLLVLLGGNSLVRVDREDGRSRWHALAADEWSSFRPLVVGDEVWVGNGQGELVALAVEDGQTSRRLEVGGVIRGFTLHEGIFYVGTLSGTLRAVRP